MLKVAVRAIIFINFQSDLENGVGFLKELKDQETNKNNKKCFPQEMCFGQFSC